VADVFVWGDVGVAREVYLMTMTRLTNVVR
jgi:hypothetical protein